MANIVEITTFEAPELDVYARLTENQLLYRADPSNAMFIAESPKVIDRALDADYEPLSLLMEGKHIEGQAKDIIARCGDIPVFTSTLDVLTRLTGFALTRGVLCAMRRKPLPDFREVIQNAKRIAVIEDVMNPTNIGAIVRSAAALNMDAILFTPACCDPLYRRAVRVSMGTIFQIPWAYIGSEPSDWPERGMTWLQELGFATVAMALREDSININDERLAACERLAVILGTEGISIL